MASVSAPTQSGAMATGSPSSSLSLSATGFRDISGTTWPLGRPRWEQAITLPPSFRMKRTVSRAARMRVSSPMTPFFNGTLKSQRSSTFLPFSGASATLFLT